MSDLDHSRAVDMCEQGLHAFVGGRCRDCGAIFERHAKETTRADEPKGNVGASPSLDVFNQLHTLRSLANQVKGQCDNQRLWTISVTCAEISELATQAIQKLTPKT